MAQNIRSSIKN